MPQCVDPAAGDAPAGWKLKCARVLLFALVVSPIGGGVTGAIVGTVAAGVRGIGAMTGPLAGFALGLEIGLINGVAAAWLVRNKPIKRLVPVLAGGVLLSSLPAAMVPSEMVILICMLAGTAGFWIALFADDAGYVDRIRERIRTNIETGHGTGHVPTALTGTRATDE